MHLYLISIAVRFILIPHFALLLGRKMDARGKSRETDNTLFPELWTTEYLRIVLEDVNISG